MKSTEINKMAEMEENYWWHIGKRILVTALVTKYFNGRKDLNILEVGCGTGGLTKILTQYGTVTGFDISEDAIAYCQSKGLKNIYVQDLLKLDTSDYKDKFDLILALDVLEHLQDDVSAMQKVRDMLSKNGLFFINVPAHKFLWSEHDEALEHKRRYHRFELLNKLKDTGFKVVSNSYFVSIVSPAMVVYRFWGNLFGRSTYPKTSYVILSPRINDLMVHLLKIETKILLKTRIPFGVTLNVVAKKMAS